MLFRSPRFAAPPTVKIQEATSLLRIMLMPADRVAVIPNRLCCHATINDREFSPVTVLLPPQTRGCVVGASTAAQNAVLYRFESAPRIFKSE